MHKSDDPRSFVGEILEANETTEGLKIRGRFDVDNEHGAAAYRQVKARRIDALSIGYRVNVATKGSDGANELHDLDLVEVSVVTRGANDRALITAAKSADTRETLRERVARAQLHAKDDNTMSFYTPTDPTNDIDRALMKVGAREAVKAADGGRWTAERDDNLTKAREICEVAKELDRDLTTAEAEQVQKHIDAAETATKAIAEGQRSAALLAQLDVMAKTAAPDSGAPAGDEDGRRLAFTKGMAAKAVTKILGDGSMGTKAVAPSGAATVDQEFTPDPVALGQPAQSLLSVLPVKLHGSPQFSYLRQSVRTNNAAIVAEGAVKPTSVYSVTKIDDQLDVIAHLSEALPRYWIVDNASLQEWLTNELHYGLMVKVEAMALATIAGTSGIQTNAYATSQLVTLRKSLTKLEANGYDPAAFVLHPFDWEAVELQVSSTNAIEHMGIPYDPVSRRLYGVPVVVTNAATEGTSHTLAQGAAAVDTDGQGVQVQWSETSNSDDWSKNLIRARCEGRFAASVFRPLGVVQSDLTA
jgi:hypothetical protein